MESTINPIMENNMSPMINNKLNHNHEYVNNIIESEKISHIKSKIVFSPLLKGEGDILAYFLRQFLFRAIKGYGIIAIRIKDVPHNFSAISNVLEDTSRIIANLKQVVIKSTLQERFTIKLIANESGDVMAQNFHTPEEVTIVNPQQYICHMTSATELEIECLVDQGYGYQEEESINNIDAHMWPIGVNFCPIINVHHVVQSLAAGRFVEMEQLHLYVETNGSIQPLDSIIIAAGRVHKVLGSFNKKSNANHHSHNHEVHIKQESTHQSTLDQQKSILSEDIEILKLKPRVYKRLKAEAIHKIRDLVTCSSEELKNIEGIGETSLNDINDSLREYNLSLNMVLSNWQE